MSGTRPSMDRKATASRQVDGPELALHEPDRRHRAEEIAQARKKRIVQDVTGFEFPARIRQKVEPLAHAVGYDSWPPLFELTRATGAHSTDGGHDRPNSRRQRT